MTTVIRREFFDVSRKHAFTIIPIGDIHLGNVHCDEELLAALIKRIAREPRTYWIGMGDYLDAINRQDKRFDSREVADWAVGAGDLVGKQIERFMDYFAPISNKCLGLVSGNHEEAILLHNERDIMSDIGYRFKQEAGWDAEHKLRLDYYGWMRLVFYRAEDGDRTHATLFTFNLHHGHGGGKLAGGKALNIQRHVWTHDADVVVFGHSHNIEAQVEAVERLDANDNIITDNRRGVYGGTFLRNAGYAIRKGYLPIPLGGCEILMKPGATNISDRIRIMT